MHDAPVTPVRILGDEFWIRGASATRVRDLAAYVDSKFQEISARAPGQDIRRLAVLVSLNLAEEIFAERDRGTQVSGEVYRKIAGCRTLLEIELAGSLADPLSGEPETR